MVYLGSKAGDVSMCNHLCRLLANLRVISYEEWFSIEEGLLKRRRAEFMKGKVV